VNIGGGVSVTREDALAADVNIDGNATIGGSVITPDDLNVGDGAVLIIAGDACPGRDLNNEGAISILGDAQPGEDLNNCGTLTIDGDAVPGRDFNSVDWSSHNATVVVVGNVSPGRDLNSCDRMTIGGTANPVHDLNNDGTLLVGGNVNVGRRLSNIERDLPNSIMTVFGDVCVAENLVSDGGANLSVGGTVAVGGVVSGTVTHFPFLAIDSNNDGTIDADDDPIEDDISLSGKIIAVDNGDSDVDSIPDFADPDVPTGGFVPMVLSVPAGIDLATAAFRFVYDASNPASDLTNDAEGHYQIAHGAIRLWRADAVPGSVWSLEQFIDPTTTYDSDGLQIDPTSRTTTLWVEAVAPSTAMADKTVRAEISPDGAGLAEFIGSDEFRLTSAWVDLDIDSDNSARFAAPDRSQEEDDEENAKAGKLLIVNRDDGDSDGIPDCADGFSAFSADVESSATPGEQFVPVVLELPQWVSGQGTIRFDYDGAPPAATIRTAAVVAGLDGVNYTKYAYSTGGGLLRL
jgi:hypothetical protein